LNHHHPQILARDLSTTKENPDYFRRESRTHIRPHRKPMRQSLFIPLLSLLVLTACSGPKALTKRGVELQDAGMNRQAAEMYYQALRRKPSYIEAMVGLRTTGQGFIDTQVGEFQRASMDGRRADALELYDEMVAYQSRIAAVNVDLLIPESLKSDYENHLDEHLIELDEEGHAQLEAEDFEGAAETFQEIIRLDADYKDAKSLLIIAQAEPFYRQGQERLADDAFRAAYDAFSKALKFDPEYKEAIPLRSQALEEGRFNVAITDFEARNRDRDVALELRSGVQQLLLQTDDAFIGVVDRTQRDEIIAEQQLSISGISDEQVEVGGLAGARAMLTGSILMYSIETGDLMTATRPGFRKYFREVPDEDGKTKKVAAYAPVQYLLHSQKREVVVKFELKLISTETSEVLFSKVDEVRSSDQVEFATSQVEAGTLYPARSNGEVNQSGKSQMTRLLNGRRELMSATSMRNQILEEAARRGTRQVETFLSSHIR